MFAPDPVAKKYGQQSIHVPTLLNYKLYFSNYFCFSAYTSRSWKPIRLPEKITSTLGMLYNSLTTCSRLQASDIFPNVSSREIWTLRIITSTYVVRFFKRSPLWCAIVPARTRYQVNTHCVACENDTVSSAAEELMSSAAYNVSSVRRCCLKRLIGVLWWRGRTKFLILVSRNSVFYC